MIYYKKGFVLVLAVAFISLMSVMVMRVVTKLIVFEKLHTVLVHREQAKQLAWSGLQVALSQICERMPKTEAPKAEDSNKEEIKKIIFELHKLMKITNQWQQIALTESTDGMDGACSVYIALERGKINPNIFEKNFKAEAAKQPSLEKERGALVKINEALNKYLQPKASGIDFIKRMEQMSSKRKMPLDDISEMMTDDHMKKLHNSLFLKPDKEFALLDFFSIEHASDKLAPWALSSSFAQVFGLQKLKKIKEEQFKKIDTAITSQQSAATLWGLILEALYGEKATQLPKEIYTLFSSQIEYDLFSVISYGTYNNVVVMVYAVVQRIQDEPNDCDYGSIKKIYWLYN